MGTCPAYWWDWRDDREPEALRKKSSGDKAAAREIDEKRLAMRIVRRIVLGVPGGLYNRMGCNGLKGRNRT
jgi:hypothetical protein